MSKLKTRLFLSLFLAVCISSWQLTVVNAQQQAGITVNPGVIKTRISAENTSEVTEVTIRNNYSVPIKLNAELNNIDETSARLVPTGVLTGDLKDALVLSETDINIPALSEKRISLQANLTDKLKPGGHYAALVLSEQSASGSSLSLRSAVSVTIFLTNETGVIEKFDLNSFETSSSLFSLPRKASVSFTNSGNVYSTPRGVMKVSGSNGQILGQAVVNAGSNPILPGNTFESEFLINHISGTFWPQRVHVSLEYRGDQSDLATQASRSVIYIPPVFIGTITLLLGILVVVTRLLVPKIVIFIRKLRHKKSTKKRKLARQQPIHIQDIVKIDNNRGKS